MTFILKLVQRLVKLLFGGGGLLVFIGKNLAGASLSVWHSHATGCDAALAAAPWVIALLGDALWFVVLILIRSRLPKLSLWLHKNVSSWVPGPAALPIRFMRAKVCILPVSAHGLAEGRVLAAYGRQILVSRKRGGAQLLPFP